MKKADVIKALKKNKINHIKQFAAAKIGFKKKALKLLKDTTAKIKKGGLGLSVSMITPIDRTDYFTNVISMFENDTQTEVTLTVSEYNEYILDKGAQAIQAPTSNTYYSNSR